MYTMYNKKTKIIMLIDLYMQLMYNAPINCFLTQYNKYYRLIPNL